MSSFVEPRIRRVVADRLGVGAEELVREVSLIDDLAADSLDLVELAIEIEQDLGITFPEAAIDALRTYGDLIDVVQVLARERREADDESAEPGQPPQIWARVVPPAGSPRGTNLQRAGWLTPYTAETIAEDALRSGRGTLLELMVPPAMNEHGLTRLRSQFAWLGDRGVEVNVHRDRHVGPSGRRRPHVAA